MRGPLVLLVAAAVASCAPLAAQHQPPPKGRRPADPRASAQRMIGASQGTLAPVYAPLAQQIADDFKLADATGIGIDVGSGPGTLIVELCARTRLHWINADINPHFFAHFYRLAESRGFGHRVSAVWADAQSLPFRDGFADVVVSRGSYHFWPDRRKGFAEIYRVLKPGGVAFIGRGFPRTMALATVRAIRAKQGKFKRYDPSEEAAALRKMLTGLGIANARIHLPTPPGVQDLHYGVWAEFRKPARP